MSSSDSQGLQICLWFDGNAEEAVAHYTSIFKDSKITSTARYPESGTGQETHGRVPGSVMTMEFELRGQRFMALNGGPLFKFNEAVSLMVRCKDQDEIDYFWEKLGEGGDPAKQACGWLGDKFGLSWQIVGDGWGNMVGSKDPAAADRSFSSMMKMKKFDIAEMTKAFEEK